MNNYLCLLSPKDEFSKAQINQLEKVGALKFVPSRDELPIDKLIQIAKHATVLGVDPDCLGGFEKAPMVLMKLIPTLRYLKGIALDTTAYHYIDLDYCSKHHIHVTNTPHYSTESVAEHTFGFLLGAAKRIFVSDRLTQKGAYKLIEGIELKGKTLGIIGLGSIGTRLSEIAYAFGMKVIAYNRTPKQITHVQMLDLDKLLETSDAISIHLALNSETRNFISKEKIELIKQGAIIVNTADRELVDEKVMAKALATDVVDSYVLEAEDLTQTPLAVQTNAFLFKGFGWFTKEALERNKQMWVESIIGLTSGKSGYHVV